MKDIKAFDVSPDDVKGAELLVYEYPGKAVAVIAAALAWWTDRTPQDGGELALVNALGAALMPPKEASK